MGDMDYSDLGFPSKPAGGWPDDPFDEDHYCHFCGNGNWKFHAPWCQWADARDAGEIPKGLPDEVDETHKRGRTS